MKTNKSKTRPVSNWRRQRQAGAMKALQRTVWSLILLGLGARGEGGGAGKSGTAKDERRRLLSNSPRRRSMEEEEDVAVGDLRRRMVEESVGKKKKKRETARVRTQGHLMKTA